MPATTVIPINRIVRVETHITILECATCNIVFGIGADFEGRRREDHEHFYCPNGHQNFYNGPTEAEKERDRYKRMYDSAEWRAKSWRDQAEAAERSRRGQKAANTRLKKRIAAGVCPCCHRTFSNVERHMSNQHPDFTAEAGNS